MLVPRHVAPSLSRIPARSARLGRAAAAARRAKGASTAAPLATASVGGGGGSTGGGSGGSGSGGGGGDGGGGEEEDEPLLSLTEAQKLAAAANAQLPADFAAAASAGGLRAGALAAWLGLQQSPASAALASLSPFLRDRLLTDPLLGFKIGWELFLDVGLSTAEELRRGSFWKEAEFHLADLLVGSVLTTLLVSLLVAPAALGKALPARLPPALARLPGLSALLALPASTLGRAPAGARFSPAARAAGLLRLSACYAAAGCACGAAGQAAANGVAAARRAARRRAGQAPSAEDKKLLASVPRTAALWAAFMGAHAAPRYAALAALDGAVMALPAARSLPALPLVVTAAARFVNHVVGGEAFAAWAHCFNVTAA